MVNYEDDLGPSGKFSYSCVVGMRLYLDGKTHPEITYVVNVFHVICSVPDIIMSWI